MGDLSRAIVAVESLLAFGVIMLSWAYDGLRGIVFMGIPLGILSLSLGTLEQRWHRTAVRAADTLEDRIAQEAALRPELKAVIPARRTLDSDERN